MTDSTSTPHDGSQPAVPPTPASGGSRPDTEGIEEIMLCSDDGHILYEWPSSVAGGRVQLFDAVLKQSNSLAQTLSLGRVSRLEVETLNGRIVLLLQPNRRLFVRSSVKRKTT
jgi:predicted regulator of Ras-like GTPase activity (Roadblock/LC7/MglB family)